MNLKYLLILLIVIIMFTKFFLSNADVTKEQAVELLNNGAVIIDVRSPSEYAAGSVPTAINIPLDELSSKAGEILKDKDTPVLLFCHSGARSNMAKKNLLGLGFSKVFNLGSLDSAYKLASYEK